MKSNFSYKTPETDITYDDIEDEVRRKVDPGFNFKIDSYEVTLNWDTEESTVYVEYSTYPERHLINIGSLNVSNDLYQALLNDNTVHKEDDYHLTFNDTIINALENYYGVKTGVKID